MARRFDAGYYLSEGVHSIFTHGFMSFAAVCMIVACLLIMGSFTLVAVNLDKNLGDLENENQLAVYIDESYTEEKARSLEEEISKIPNVTDISFVTKAEALSEFQEKRENVEMFQNLPEDVLRDRYYVHMNDIELISQTKQDLENVPGVAKVVAAVEIAEGFVMIRNIATGVALVLVGILLIVSLFIIANTIKLATFYRREEIAIMKLCGATDGFIRWPFVVEGMALGLTGSLVAFFLQWGIYHLVATNIVQSNGLSLMTMISYTSMIDIILPVFCGVGVVIGVGGSLIAIRKFLQV